MKRNSWMSTKQGVGGVSADNIYSYRVVRMSDWDVYVKIKVENVKKTQSSAFPTSDELSNDVDVFEGCGVTFDDFTRSDLLQQTTHDFTGTSFV